MTANTLKYKGYEGSVDFDFSDNLLSGKVLGIRAGLVYEAQTLQELQTAFRQTIDDYLQYCKNENLVPEKPFPGILIFASAPSDIRQSQLMPDNTASKSMTLFARQ